MWPTLRVLRFDARVSELKIMLEAVGKVPAFPLLNRKGETKTQHKNFKIAPPAVSG